MKSMKMYYGRCKKCGTRKSGPKFCANCENQKYHMEKFGDYYKMMSSLMKQFPALFHDRM